LFIERGYDHQKVIGWTWADQSSATLLALIAWPRTR
jgi:hypothetical protein